jgi:hypothetical protein
MLAPFLRIGGRCRTLRWQVGARRQRVWHNPSRSWGMGRRIPAVPTRKELAATAASRDRMDRASR